jgi:pyruvate kinase
LERIAEMEELLWVCEAAAVPAVWATQVLEDLVKTGLPSRGEMTDAAMGTRSECVAEQVSGFAEAVELLDSLLARLDIHLPTLRRLYTW